MKSMRTTSLLWMSLIVILGRAQTAGSLVSTFNVLDKGNGIGDPTPRRSADINYYQSVDHAISIADGSGGTFRGTTTATEGGTRIGYIERLNYDGSINPAFNAPTISGYVYALALQSDGKLLVGGKILGSGALSGRNNLFRLNTDGTVDGSFAAVDYWGVSAERVRVIKVQSDGKILIGGSFGFYGSGNAVSDLTRLNNDGTRDITWYAGSLGGTNGEVFDIALQSDGKVLVGGDFTLAGGQSRQRIVRFDPPNRTTNWVDGSFNTGTGSNATVRSIALQTDGKVVLAGDLTSFNGTACGRIIRLMGNGTLDGTWSASPGFNATVNALEPRNDGTILAGGDFTTCQGASRVRVALLNANGSVSNSFDTGSGPNGSVRSLLTRSDGKVLIEGSFYSFAGVVAQGRIRTLPSGAIDNTYSYNASNGPLTSLAIQGDGKILTGGGQTAYNGKTQYLMMRLLPDGSVDDSFTAGISYEPFIAVGLFKLYAVAVKPDGRILVAGLLRNSVNSSNTTDGHGLARMLVNGDPDPSFTAAIAQGHEARALTLMTDDRIIAAEGPYSTPTSNTLRRFLTDGAIDPSFAPGVTTTGLVERTAVLPDGKILVAGTFLDYAGTGRHHLLRLNADGSLDPSFNSVEGFNGGSPAHLLLLSNGQVIVSGSFTSYDGHAAPGLCRLNADGSFDTGFAPTVQGGGPLVQDFSGKLVVGARYRLNNDGTTDPSFNTGSGFADAYGPVEPLAVAVHRGNLITVGAFTSFNGTGRNRIASIVSVPMVNMPVSVRALFEGPYDQASTLMNDGLRAGGLLPLNEPFSALGFQHVDEPNGSTATTGVFNVATPTFNSIVDWAMLELRDPTMPSVVLQTRTGLIQRDGEIVSTDGISPLVFNYPAGSYHIAVRSRNHLGCMTAAPIALSTSTTNIVFSLASTATYGIDARKIIGTRAVLWAGDTGHDGSIRYTGAGNDRDPVLQKVGSTPNGSVIGYFTEDVNMDGIVRYTGAANDRDPILVNVGSTTPNNVRGEQVP